MYSKWPLNIRNGWKLLQMVIKRTNICNSEALQKYTQIGILGKKVNHLATLFQILKRQSICSVGLMGGQLRCFKWASPLSTCRRHFFPHQGDQGPMLWFFKYFCRKILRKNWRFWLKTKLNFWKKLIITLVFKKNANFLAENWEKWQKIVIITSTTDWANFRLLGNCLLWAAFWNSQSRGYQMVYFQAKNPN
jgi:hypothetical protein